MIRTRRERTLAMTIGGLLTAVLLWDTSEAFLLRPFQSLQLELDNIQQSQTDLDLEELSMLKASGVLGDMSQRSLPSDPGIASTLYQEWLIAELRRAGIDTPSVIPAPAIEDEELGHRLTFSVEARGTTAAISRFLDVFSSRTLLHRMTSLQLTNPSMGDDDELQATISIEALALADQVHTELPPDIASNSPRKTMLTSLLQKNNVFWNQPPVPVKNTPPTNVAVTPVLPDPPVQPTPPPQPPPVPVEQGCRFAGSILSNGQRLALFVDQRNGDMFAATTQDWLELADAEILVVEIRDDEVVLELEGRRFTVSLGNTIQEQSDADQSAAELGQRRRG